MIVRRASHLVDALEHSSQHDHGNHDQDEWQEDPSCKVRGADDLIAAIAPGTSIRNRAREVARVSGSTAALARTARRLAGRAITLAFAGRVVRG